jgi:hypothetical protein
MDRLPRRFQLVRLEDPGGISGVGVVADGVEFSDGTAVLRWTTAHRSTAILTRLTRCWRFAVRRARRQ